MIKSEKPEIVEKASGQDTSSEVQAANDEQPAPRKETLMEHLRSKRMRTVMADDIVNGRSGGVSGTYTLDNSGSLTVGITGLGGGLG